MAMMENKYYSDSITPVCTTALDLPPSCVEFSPEARDYFVVGTYNLEKEDNVKAKEEEDGAVDEETANTTSKKRQSRNGSLILLKILEDKL